MSAVVVHELLHVQAWHAGSLHCHTNTAEHGFVRGYTRLSLSTRSLTVINRPILQLSSSDLTRYAPLVTENGGYKGMSIIFTYLRGATPRNIGPGPVKAGRDLGGLSRTCHDKLRHLKTIG